MDALINNCLSVKYFKLNNMTSGQNEKIKHVDRGILRTTLFFEAFQKKIKSEQIA